ncbi:MAG: hypothetical protein R6W70_06360 [bacterium]
MKIILFAVISFSIFFIEAGSTVADMRAYFKSFAAVYNLRENSLPGDSPENPYLFQQNIFRMTIISDFSDNFTTEAAYSVFPTLNQLPGKTGALFSPDVDSYRVFDLSENIMRKSDMYMGHNLDRMNFSLSAGFADIIAGRQVVSFGSARFFNPTDVFSPFSFQELNKEEKTGVDAVRLRIPLGSMSELDMGYVFGEKADWRKSAAFLRGVFPFFDYDVSLMAIQYRTHLMTGFNLSGNIKGAGAWLEAAYTFNSILESREKDGDFFRVSTGADYYFANDIYVFAEYHYNSAGSLSPGEYMTNINSNPAAYSDSGVYLFGEHYLAPGADWQIHPLVGLKVQILLNLTDPSLMAVSSLKISLSDNTYFDMGATFPFGKKPEKGDFFPELKSEFGTYPFFVYLNFSAYF